MSEMVDRVAAAIRRADDETDGTTTSLARAAIAAMREPTDEMFKGDWWKELNEGPPTRRAHWIWQSMINEALK